MLPFPFSSHIYNFMLVLHKTILTKCKFMVVTIRSMEKNKKSFPHCSTAKGNSKLMGVDAARRS